MAVALSTSWNAYRFHEAAGLLFEIKQLGFKAIELSFNLTPKLFEDIAQTAAGAGIDIQSVHNYCPIPDGLTPAVALPDCYSLSALDEDERARAVKYTKATIANAAKIGARAVVLHCGRVGIRDSTRALINLYNQGASQQAEFARLKEEMIAQRKIRSPEFLKQVLTSLEELNLLAKQQGVTLGIETRFYHCEIPDISEIGIILDKFPASQIGYWHDTGHAQLMENLGFFRHQDFLELYQDRLLGVHLHDIAGCQDHLAPATGKFDFNLLKPYIKKSTLKVIEAHAPATAQELIKSREFIAQLFDS